MNRLPQLPATLVLILGIAWIAFYHNDIDTDLFGHVTIGERIIETREIPRTNTYSYTEPDHPWINQYWLSEVIFALIYRGFGDTGLILFMMGMSLAIVCILFKLIRKRFPEIAPLTVFVTLIITIGALRSGITIRPQLFTYLFTAILLYFLTEMKITKKLFYILPTIFIFWTNLHGGVVAGFGILFIWSLTMVIRHRKWEWKRVLSILAGLWILTLIISLINPYGIGLHKFLLFATRLDHTFLIEWKPITWFDFSDLFIKLVLPVYIPILLITIFWRRNVEVFPTVMTLITLYLALTHVRHIAFFALTLPAFLPVTLDWIFKKYGAEILMITNKIISSWSNYSSRQQLRLKIEFLLIVLSTTWLGNISPFRLLLSLDDYPIAHVKWLKNNHLSGNILNSYNWGYYLMRELYPHFRIATDGRYETCYSVDYMESFLKFFYQEDTTLAFIKEYSPDYIILEQDSKVARAVNQSPYWRAINWNRTAVLFAPTEWVDRHRNMDFQLPRLHFPEDIFFH